MEDSDDLPKLPEGWVWVKLVELCTAIGDVDHKMPKAQEEGIPYVSTKDFLQDGQINFDGAKKISEEDFKRLCRKIYPERGDILLSRYGTVGEVRLVKTDLAFQASYSIAILKPVSHQVNKFIATALQSEPIQAQIKNYVRGVAQPDLGLAHIRELNLAFPPLAEQKRIIAKIEELFTQLDAGVELLKKVKAQLKRYRQAVLKAAVEGKLTKDWREAHQGELEPASVLLERILKERREKWEAEQLAQMKAKGITPKDGKWKQKYKEPDEPDISDLAELPSGWVWVSIEQIIEVGTGATPLRSNFKYYQSGSIPWVTSGALNEPFVTQVDEMITKLAVNETNAKVFPKHTLLVAMYGEGKTRGKVSELLIDAATNQACAALLFTGQASILRPYIKLFFHKNYDDIRRLSSGGVQPNLNLSIIKNTEVPLPPWDEQQKIYEEVERCLSVTDKLYIVVEQSLRRAERLRQSILKKAFEGKLVPQDPNDEPADKLLERIKAEKAKLQTQKTEKRIKSKKTNLNKLELPLES